MSSLKLDVLAVEHTSQQFQSREAMMCRNKAEANCEMDTVAFKAALYFIMSIFTAITALLRQIFDQCTSSSIRILPNRGLLWLIAPL